jgi:hypothetical protein
VVKSRSLPVSKTPSGYIRAVKKLAQYLRRSRVAGSCPSVVVGFTHNEHQEWIHFKVLETTVLLINQNWFSPTAFSYSSTFAAESSCTGASICINAFFASRVTTKCLKTSPPKIPMYPAPSLTLVPVADLSFFCE